MHPCASVLSQSVSDVMTIDVNVVSGRQPLERCLRTMVDKGFRHLPVLSTGGRVDVSFSFSSASSLWSSGDRNDVAHMRDECCRKCQEHNKAANWATAPGQPGHTSNRCRQWQLMIPSTERVRKTRRNLRMQWMRTRCSLPRWRTCRPRRGATGGTFVACCRARESRRAKLRLEIFNLFDKFGLQSGVYALCFKPCKVGRHDAQRFQPKVVVVL